MDWQPIETWCPTIANGQPHRALLYRPGGPLGTYKVVYWAQEPLPRPMGMTGGQHFRALGWTRWMPLPPPPAAETSDG